MKKRITTSSWDAVLNTDVCDEYNNADLTLTLKMGFKQINPSGGAASGTYHDYGSPSKTARKIIRWTPTEWAKWKSHFVRSAKKFWHGKFWLINNFSEFEFERGGVKYLPNVWCKFNLIGGDASAGTYHHVIEVVRLHRSETWFGSHSRLYDSLDTRLTRKGTNSKGNAIMQRAHVHEVGHLLGLGHVDIGKPHCPSTGNTNSAPCYGVADTDKLSVMGQGMQLRAQHANPWRRAMKKITGKGNIGSQLDWSPRKTRHYPRTKAEVAANQHVTSRPKR
ncbi:hypothetical protein MNBD_GAMMA15-1258 [hydrothermal vent metagenome]|uniref:Uncharacterized protein n=1 Tax=hydrothermal vent metagenome TaxID=652676 RepID=A0A3B0YER0_9ZZZZ